MLSVHHRPPSLTTPNASHGSNSGPNGIGLQGVPGGRSDSLQFPKQLTTASTEDAELLDCISHYSIYGLAIYSLYILIYMRPCSSSCLLSKKSCDLHGCCCSCLCHSGGASAYSSSSLGTVVGDNVCGTQRLALEVLMEDRETELIFSSFENHSCPPFAVVLDHTKRAVVVSVRGTMSLEDCVRDVDIEPVELAAAGERWGFNGTGVYMLTKIFNSL